METNVYTCTYNCNWIEKFGGRGRPELSNYFEWFEPQHWCVSVRVCVFVWKKKPTVKISRRCKVSTVYFHIPITISPFHTWCVLFCDKILGTRFISDTQLKYGIKETPRVFCSNARTNGKRKPWCRQRRQSKRQCVCFCVSVCNVYLWGAA